MLADDDGTLRLRVRRPARIVCAARFRREDARAAGGSRIDSFGSATWAARVRRPDRGRRAPKFAGRPRAGFVAAWVVASASDPCDRRRHAVVRDFRSEASPEDLMVVPSFAEVATTGSHQRISVASLLESAARAPLSRPSFYRTGQGIVADHASAQHRRAPSDSFAGTRGAKHPRPRRLCGRSSTVCSAPDVDRVRPGSPVVTGLLRPAARSRFLSDVRGRRRARPDVREDVRVGEIRGAASPVAGEPARELPDATVGRTSTGTATHWRGRRGTTQ